MKLVAQGMTSTSRSRQAGFSLLGVLFLILVTSGAVLITVMLVPLTANRQTKETMMKGKALRAAIEAYKKDHLSFLIANGTTKPAALTALVTNDNLPGTCTFDNTPADATYKTLQGWCGPYLDQVIVENADDYRTDGWGTLFDYVQATDVLTSCGPNRICGTGGDDLTF